MKSSGVSFYTKGGSWIENSWPEDKVCCATCLRFLKRYSPFDVWHCVITDELILYPEKGIGDRCPFREAVERLSKEE